MGQIGSESNRRDGPTFYLTDCVGYIHNGSMDQKPLIGLTRLTNQVPIRHVLFTSLVIDKYVYIFLYKGLVFLKLMFTLFILRK